MKRDSTGIKEKSVLTITELADYLSDYGIFASIYVVGDKISIETEYGKFFKIEKASKYPGNKGKLFVKTSSGESPFFFNTIEELLNVKNESKQDFNAKIIEIKEEVRIGKFILEKGDKIQIIENFSLPFTKQKGNLPKDLIKSLGYLGVYLIGFGQTDKGYIIEFDRPLSIGAERELLKLLKIESWQLEKDDDNPNQYFIDA